MRLINSVYLTRGLYRLEFMEYHIISLKTYQAYARGMQVDDD